MRSTVRCIDRHALAGAALCAVALSACTPPAPPPAPAVKSTPSAPAPATPPAAAASAARSVAPVRKEDALRLLVARRIVAAHPDTTYLGPAPDPVLAIPVLQIELNADGSVRRIEVLRQPRQARETTQMAIDAVRRAAPYGDISALPKPWKFTETFLFDETRRFKPRTLEP